MDLQRRLPALLSQSVLVGALACPWSRSADAPKFYPDDPVEREPRHRDASTVKMRKPDALFDFIYNSFEPAPQKIAPAGNTNTLGEVVDGTWYVNRHFRRRMSLEELRRGPGDATPPRPPYTVVGAKLDGISPGFRMKDSLGVLYFVKPDPLSAPEIATAADAIGSRFFYALGYHTPENYIVEIDPKEISVAKAGTTDGANGKPRPMTLRDVYKVLWKIPRTASGRYRFLASQAVGGTPVGPFRYEGTRSDDPNDVVPHENRRELRGLHVFCAWLNHTDAKSGNSLDALVEERGVKYVRHHLIDFGAILGSDSDMVKNARFGHGHIIPTGSEAARGVVSFGLRPYNWETAKTPKIRGVGRFESTAFDPEKWVSNFPNRAFIHRLPDDEYWAARQVMAFTDEEIRAVVETGQYSDPKAVDYMTRNLIQRRDAIGRVYLSKVLALDHFRVEGGRLRFEDLATKYRITPAREYEITWHALDNVSRQLTPLPGVAGDMLPSAVLATGPGKYFAARIHTRAEPNKSVTVYLRAAGNSPTIVGIDRAW